jgi:multicomponent Na+:H+ antiporter subunit E
MTRAHASAGRLRSTVVRHVGRLVFLTTIWVLLWGSLSVANVLSGVAVALVLLAVSPLAGSRSQNGAHRAPAGVVVGSRLLGWLRLLARIVGQLIVSNAVIAREIVTPGSRIRTGIVACPLHTDSEHVVTFMANVLALTPGTMPVHVQVNPPVIYVHVLHLAHPDATRRSIARLEALAVRAFGASPAEVAST